MIRYIPNLDTYLWAKKSLVYFDTIDELKHYIADQRTRFCRFIGRMDKTFRSVDVTFSDPLIPDPFICWKNYRSITVDGITVGYCGE